MPRWPAAITVLVALAVAILVSREQMREQRLEEERRRARDRIQTRARDILADYEETRQGWFWETDRRAPADLRLGPGRRRRSAARPTS